MHKRPKVTACDCESMRFSRFPVHERNILVIEARVLKIESKSIDSYTKKLHKVSFRIRHEDSTILVQGRRAIPLGTRPPAHLPSREAVEFVWAVLAEEFATIAPELRYVSHDWEPQTTLP